jgi:YbbR domain-containing protein
MPEWIRKIGKVIPTFLTAFLLAVAIWILAVTSNDPTQVQSFPRAITLEIVGQDPSLVITSNIPKTMGVTLSAPQSVWNRLNSEQNPVRAILDLSGMGVGTVEIAPQVQVSLRPARVISTLPEKIQVTLEKLTSKSFSVMVIQRGEVAVGYQASSPAVDQEIVTVSGPESQVAKVDKVRVVLDLTQANQTINATLPLEALDASGSTVSGVTITPEKVNVSAEILQRGGYRNVVVKVVPSGQVSSGYRLTSISVFPPTVTVFSRDPAVVNTLPGYVETQPLDLNGKKDDFEQAVTLNLPSGVTVVGDQKVKVQVGISAIEGSLTLSSIPLEYTGLASNLMAKSSPQVVDVILSGPLPVLDKITARDLRVMIDLTGVGPGTYKKEPKVQLTITDIQVQSILPASIEVTVITKTGTPTVTP